jgi:hypothetical protein
MTGFTKPWRLLYRGNEVATFMVVDSDFPWLYGKVYPSPRFAEVRSVFDEEITLINTDPDDERWDEIYERIREEFRLVAPDDIVVPEFLLHIDGEDAWWRWSDTPFDSTDTTR